MDWWIFGAGMMVVVVVTVIARLLAERYGHPAIVVAWLLLVLAIALATGWLAVLDAGLLVTDHGGG